ncbi:MAG: acyl-CoA dehydrogenase [Candidatus Binatota bacterium]|jgi:alkylation response protein AidB-like acyl-CoA dehydrogenase|nr:acyl-CoA dehydrogenase [Candidatus Binatota bacterium]
MDFQLTEEQRIALDAFARFAEAEIRPITDRHRERPIPHDVAIDLLRALVPYGVVGGWLPESAGGVGLDMVTSGLLYEELARVSPDLAGTAFINEGVSLTLHALASPEQQARLLPRLLAGEIVGCSAITEPDVGSNVRDVKTTATRDGDEYVIRGEKTWISNGGISDFVVVVARSGPGEISLFLVEREAHGYTSRDLPKLGLNGWSTAELSFDEVRVPAANLLGRPGAGLRETLRLFERARCFVAVISIGIARAALDAAIVYARDRRQWGKPIGGHQLIQEMIADMATDLDAARLLTVRGLALVQAGVRCEAETSMAKWYATEAAVRIASSAIQVHGAYGLSRELPVEQHFRDARMMTIPDGTTQIQKLIIARKLLGIDAFGPREG